MQPSHTEPVSTKFRRPTALSGIIVGVSLAALATCTPKTPPKGPGGTQTHTGHKNLKGISAHIAKTRAKLAERNLGAVLTRLKPEKQRAEVATNTEAFAEPTVVESVDGELNLTLNVAAKQYELNGDQVILRTYNGRIVGPTMKVKPGDTLKITLNNELAPTEGECDAGLANTPADQPADCEDGGDYPNHNDPSHFRFNDTNLHVHGLHVSPMGTSDNIFLNICPGASQQYEIKIPADHHPGTHWYHAHVHGATAVQMGNGMSGMIVIDGGIDTVPAVAAARDRPFVFQQIPYTMCIWQNGTCTPKAIGGVEWQQVVDTWNQSTNYQEVRPTFINGYAHPNIVMKRGAVERWRFVHAGILENIQAVLLSQAQYDFVVAELAKVQDDPTHTFDWPEGESLYRISTDGITSGLMQDLKEIELAPGNRADVMVKAPSTCPSGDSCTYYLIDREAMNGLKGWEAANLLATVQFGSEAQDMPLPTADALATKCAETNCAPASLESATVEDADKQVLTFADQFGQAGVSAYNINGQAFRPCVARRLRLGKVGEWTLSTYAQAPVNWNHPYHIHVNPFQVLSITPAAGESLSANDQANIGLFRDTILVRRGWTYTIRTKYERFTGSFVTHCHILNHEDQGMMEMLRVVAGDE